MNQVQIGRFIAETRKELRMTQRQLADTLSISDKTVSKWECGNGLPEVSLMLPLCEALHITVNDLLSGERVSEAAYQEKAEKNMMRLMQENQESRRKMAISVVCGTITIIAVFSLVVIASYIGMPVPARIALLVLAAAVGVCGIGAAAMLEIRAGCFECPDCGAHFVPDMKDYVKGCHTLVRRRLTCPECGKTGMCRHRITQ